MLPGHPGSRRNYIYHSTRLTTTTTTMAPSLHTNIKSLWQHPLCEVTVACYSPSHTKKHTHSHTQTRTPTPKKTTHTHAYTYSCPTCLRMQSVQRLRAPRATRLARGGGGRAGASVRAHTHNLLCFDAKIVSFGQPTGTASNARRAGGHGEGERRDYAGTSNVRASRPSPKNQPPPPGHRARMQAGRHARTQATPECGGCRIDRKHMARTSSRSRIQITHVLRYQLATSHIILYRQHTHTHTHSRTRLYIFCAWADVRARVCSGGLRAYVRAFCELLPKRVLW